MKNLIKKTTVIVLLMFGMSVALVGCGTSADNSGMGATSSINGSIK